MHPGRTHPTRRLLRPALALALVVAQAVSAFGFPLVGVGAAACGCVGPCGVSDGCCCKVKVPAPTPAPVKPCAKCDGVAVVAPKCSRCVEREARTPAACARCRTAAADVPPAVSWVPAAKARECRGDGPLGLFAEVAAVPPVIPAAPPAVPLPAGALPVTDAASASHVSVPLDPPPWCG